jgi:hypothetical protein
MKLHIMHSLLSLHPFRSKYSNQHPVHKHAHLCSVLNMTDQVSQHTKITHKISFVYFNLYAFRQHNRETKLYSTVSYDI